MRLRGDHPRQDRRLGRRGLAVGVCALGAGLGGCTDSSLFLNLTAAVSGDVTFVFINQTPYRAVFSFGTYDELDRTPGPVNMDQLRLEAHTTSEPLDLPCGRNAAVGTQALITRALQTNADEVEDFDPEAFTPLVGFSSFPADSTGAGLADAGYADGREVLLGVDFGCGDTVFFTFVEDGSAAGGFRIEFSVLEAEPRR